ncbi:hypothetical protein GDO81_004879 [Engystomops pustulosus]|uniref:Uncharacterized protein n=1 Tax=Engystomops pustulosus TaxID=76066 RepID=A0AAV7CJR6_ENGPU|nr:hypothetical protein GDO81_004879 [Engystomops pustulosus]
MMEKVLTGRDEDDEITRYETKKEICSPKASVEKTHENELSGDTTEAAVVDPSVAEKAEVNVTAQDSSPSFSALKTNHYPVFSVEGQTDEMKSDIVSDKIPDASNPDSKGNAQSPICSVE